MIGIQADLGGQVEGDGEAGGAVGQQIFVAFVGFFGVAHAGILAHGPEAAAVHGGLDAAGIGIVAGVSDVAVLVSGVQIGRGVERTNRECGRRFRDRRVVRLGFGAIRHLRAKQENNHEARAHEGKLASS